MFQGLRWRLLAYQLSVMAAILGVYGLGVYSLFSRGLYRQLDQKLMTLAQAATPSMSAVAVAGESYLDDLNEVPWRDIFNRNRQSLEWFDASGDRLAVQGDNSLSVSPKIGIQMIATDPPIRAYTVSVFETTEGTSTTQLQGFIRASQTVQEVQTSQQQLLVGLTLGGGVGLALVGLGGLWLTRVSVRPIERSYQQLRQFTADASHELRGPITAIKTSVDVIQKHPERIHAKDEKKFQAIASASQQLQLLTEDLLLLARVDEGDRAIAHEPIILNHCLREVIARYGDLAKSKGLALHLQENTEAQVRGSASQLNRLFTNLVQNALYYTQSGRVTVSLSRTSRYARVQVEDTGIGIAPADLPHVFDRFWRADKARSRRAGGSGLGLAIAHAITQQHRGKIWVTSQPRSGSCFHVLLPIMEQPEG